MRRTSRPEREALPSGLSVAVPKPWVLQAWRSTPLYGSDSIADALAAFLWQRSVLAVAALLLANVTPRPRGERVIIENESDDARRVPFVANQDGALGFPSDSNDTPKLSVACLDNLPRCREGLLWSWHQNVSPLTPEIQTVRQFLSAQSSSSSTW